MDTKQMLDRLDALMNMDYDAINGYNRALDDIDDKSIRQQLEAFRGDHEHHVQDYQQLIQIIGGKAEEPHRDLKGAFMEAMAAIQSKMGIRNALKAVESAEKTINSKYQNALLEDFPENIKQVIERNYADERRHLSYIQQAVKNQAAA